MSDPALPAFIRYLLDGKAYPHSAPRVDLMQTHISYVFLAGAFAYKFKKPVSLGFLDFSTLAKRRFYCEQEVTLNRRLCPTIYLGVVALTEEGSVFAFDGPGQPVEYGVRMRRMPEERMMINLIKAGKLSAAMIDQVVEVLVPFYANAEGGERVRSFGTARAVGVNVIEDFDQTRDYVNKEGLTSQQLSRIESYSRSFLAREEVFRKRLAAGRIRDCHGDLHSGNICLGDQVYIYDCIEFNERFRYADVASDVAFLAMDLDFHGLSGLADRFASRFAAAAGDPSLFEVLEFYKCYRAYVRGKIGLLTAHSEGIEERAREAALARACRYFELAARYAGS